jgi:hypothetical protein
MSDSKNFAAQILGKSTSSRSLTDPVPEPKEDEPELPSPQLMIDSLYQIMMERFDKLEALVQKDCQCQKK